MSITFQNGLSSQFNNAFPLLQQHDLKATFFIISSEADTTAVQAIAAEGQEIGSQTVTNTDLTTLLYNQQVSELSQSQLYLQQLTGQKIDTVAYPNGVYNTSVMNVARNYYIAARSANSEALNSSSPNPNQFYKLIAIGPHDHYGSGDANAVAGLRYWADRAASDQKWLIELFHGIDTGYDEISSQALSTHLDYLVANGPNLWVALMGTVSEYIYIYI